ncbi:hypothetical protein [Rhodococcus sp. H29-C3]|uniref:hypothetical protein n=1 Tax=Rhodococcus sp. H29-C3 TaxID=3046307 RepID=UPI0024BA6739|nr:hypothetical protein [Rhodococcus sp. H29-C3]MDJ0363245.1 hypothetical protein [Rhodococcus sp. H29-C3]
MGWLGIFNASIPVFLALFSGWLAWRLARKTPHENLKALVEIEAALSPNIQDAGAIRNAIELELKRLEKSTVAHDSKWREVLWSRILDNLAAVCVGGFTVVSFAVAIVVLNRVGLDGQSMGGNPSTPEPPKSNSDIVLAVIGVTVAAALALAGTFWRFKRDRALLVGG